MNDFAYDEPTDFAESNALLYALENNQSATKQYVETMLDEGTITTTEARNLLRGARRLEGAIHLTLDSHHENE